MQVKPGCFCIMNSLFFKQSKTIKIRHALPPGWFEIGTKSAEYRGWLDSLRSLKALNSASLSWLLPSAWKSMLSHVSQSCKMVQQKGSYKSLILPEYPHQQLHLQLKNRGQAALFGKRKRVFWGTKFEERHLVILEKIALPYAQPPLQVSASSRFHVWEMKEVKPQFAIEGRFVCTFCLQRCCLFLWYASEGTRGIMHQKPLKTYFELQNLCKSRRGTPSVLHLYSELCKGSSLIAAVCQWPLEL